MPRYSSARNQFIPVGPGGDAPTVYTADGAIGIADGTHVLAKTSAAAMTLAAPAASDDGMRIVIRARTAFAHVVTVAGGLGGNAADDVITFAKVGDAIELLADNLKWAPIGAPYGAVIS
jgi:hypothetical protein